MRVVQAKPYRLTPWVVAVRTLCAPIGWSLLAPGLALAAPTGSEVVGGAVAISTPDVAHTVVNQTSQNAVVNWQQFNVGSQEYVIFNQPNASAAILNRIIGGDASTILGNITANGRVFLINPNGIIFGQGSKIDVGSLVASTLHIKNEDFMAGHYVFTGNSQASVVNSGTIVAGQKGFVVLAGDSVSNNGVIQAQLGQVVLASGSAMTLDLNGDGLINFKVDQAALSDRAGVANLGDIIAEGGIVVMTAKTAGELTRTTVNNSGLIKAQRISEKGGAIYLTADGGSVATSGTLDASGKNGQNGGAVLVHADGNIHHSGTIKVTGKNGGVARLVAEWQLTTELGSLIDGRADDSVIGKGGTVELSGHQGISLKGETILGKGGTLLLDPDNLTIYGGDSPSTTADGSAVYETDIEHLLNAGTDVYLVAAKNVGVDSHFYGGGYTYANSSPGDGSIDAFGTGKLTIGIGSVNAANSFTSTADGAFGPFGPTPSPVPFGFTFASAAIAFTRKPGGEVTDGIDLYSGGHTSAGATALDINIGGAVDIETGYGHGSVYAGHINAADITLLAGDSVKFGSLAASAYSAEASLTVQAGTTIDGKNIRVASDTDKASATLTAGGAVNLTEASDELNSDGHPDPIAAIKVYGQGGTALTVDAASITVAGIIGLQDHTVTATSTVTSGPLTQTYGIASASLTSTGDISTGDITLEGANTSFYAAGNKVRIGSSPGISPGPAGLTLAQTYGDRAASIDIRDVNNPDSIVFSTNAATAKALIVSTAPRGSNSNTDAKGITLNRGLYVTGPSTYVNLVSRTGVESDGTLELVSTGYAISGNNWTAYTGNRWSFLNTDALNQTLESHAPIYDSGDVTWGQAVLRIDGPQPHSDTATYTSTSAGDVIIKPSTTDYHGIAVYGIGDARTAIDADSLTVASVTGPNGLNGNIHLDANQTDSNGDPGTVGGGTFYDSHNDMHTIDATYGRAVFKYRGHEKTAGDGGGNVSLNDLYVSGLSAEVDIKGAVHDVTLHNASVLGGLDSVLGAQTYSDYNNGTGNTLTINGDFNVFTVGFNPNPDSHERVTPPITGKFTATGDLDVEGIGSTALALRAASLDLQGSVTVSNYVGGSYSDGSALVAPDPFNKAFVYFDAPVQSAVHNQGLTVTSNGDVVLGGNIVRTRVSIDAGGALGDTIPRDALNFNHPLSVDAGNFTPDTVGYVLPSPNIQVTGIDTYDGSDTATLSINFHADSTLADLDLDTSASTAGISINGNGSTLTFTKAGEIQNWTSGAGGISITNTNLTGTFTPPAAHGGLGSYGGDIVLHAMDGGDIYIGTSSTNTAPISTLGFNNITLTSDSGEVDINHDLLYARSLLKLRGDSFDISGGTILIGHNGDLHATKVGTIGDSSGTIGATIINFSDNADISAGLLTVQNTQLASLNIDTATTPPPPPDPNNPPDLTATLNALLPPTASITLRSDSSLNFLNALVLSGGSVNLLSGSVAPIVYEPLLNTATVVSSLPSTELSGVIIGHTINIDSYGDVFSTPKPNGTTTPTLAMLAGLDAAGGSNPTDGALAVRSEAGRIDLHSAVTDVGSGFFTPTADFPTVLGLDPALLASISQKTNPNLSPNTASPNAAFDAAQGVDFGQLHLASNSYLYVRAPTGDANYGGSNLDITGSITVASAGIDAAMQPLPGKLLYNIVPTDSTAPIVLYAAQVNALLPDYEVTLAFGSSSYSGNINVSTDVIALDDPNITAPFGLGAPVVDPPVNLVFLTAGAVTGTQNLTLNGQVVALKQVTTQQPQQPTAGALTPPAPPPQKKDEDKPQNPDAAYNSHDDHKLIQVDNGHPLDTSKSCS